ncbi:hypothetical protein [Lacunimicrobium album]
MATTTSKEVAPPIAISGVQELIDRIRNEGVARGEKSSEELIAAARQEAAAIVDQSRRDAEKMLAAAKKASDDLKIAGDNAVRLAIRDATLTLTEELRTDFASKVRKLVAHTMKDRQFLERLILEIARRATPPDTGSNVEMLLPDRISSSEQIQNQPEELTSPLSQFVLELSSEVLREGLTFTTNPEDQIGIRLRLRDQNVEIDLTDRAITDLLMAHLGPRFRALMKAGEA